MTDIVLRVSGGEVTRTDALSIVPASRVEKVWAAGEVWPRTRGRSANDRPAFNVLVGASENDQGSAIEEARAVLQSKAEEIVALAKRGARAELDFGVYVDASGAGMKSLRLDADFLGLLARTGVTLCVTAYVVGDDDDETPSGEASADEKGSS